MNKKQIKSNTWFANRHSTEMQHLIRGITLYSTKSKYQTIEVFDTNIYGRLLILDGEIQVSDKYTTYTHESLTHPALLCHPNPKTVLIIGGGDGGCLPEVLKYSSVKKVELVEIDNQVIEVSKKYFDLNKYFANPKINVIVMDAFAYCKITPNKYDVIIFDLSDPVGSAAKIFTQEFLFQIKKLLNPNGIVITHCESPDSAGKLYYQIIATFKSVFKIVRPFRIWIPHYIDFWGRLTASDTIDPEKVSESQIATKLKRLKESLSYLNPKLFKAMFNSFSNDILKELNKKHKIITKKSKLVFSRP